jgi:rod shape determining protein RodA
MPITGIPLPFLSYGGSFLVVTFMAAAIAQRVAAEHSREPHVSGRHLGST